MKLDAATAKRLVRIREEAPKDPDGDVMFLLKLRHADGAYMAEQYPPADAAREPPECRAHGHVWVGVPADGYPASYKCSRPGCTATAVDSERMARFRAAVEETARLGGDIVGVDLDDARLLLRELERRGRIEPIS